MELWNGGVRFERREVPTINAEERKIFIAPGTLFHPLGSRCRKGLAPE